jgi:uncharacterized membrane protein
MMSENQPPQAREPLEYARPQESTAGKTGCLVLAILLASGVGLLSGFAALFLLGAGRWYLALLLVGLPLIATYIAVRLRPRGIRVAVAITVIAAATFLLTFGLCAVA